ESLRGALAACRASGADAAAEAGSQPAASAAEAGTQRATSGDLASAVAGELALACRRLDARERELLALRDLLGLSHGEIGVALELDAAAVPALLASARVALREAVRGPGAPQPACADRDRALAGIERRHDGVALDAAEEDWLIDHLAGCRGCAQAHAAALEAAACYGAWDAVS
ncbi:MAG: sigma factor-like helix-turn-helix DNA-binding protein, partial [Solirubrobacteraceae bacterium]